jgi:hypothetical protein
MAAESAANPDWARSWDPAALRRFMEEVFRAASKRGKTTEVPDGVSIAGKVRPLAEMAEVCRHMPEKHWPGVVEGHFARIDRREAAAEALRGKPGGREAADRLRVRIVPDRTLEDEAGKMAVAIPVAPGLSAVLELAGRGKARPERVSAGMADDWGVATEALFDIARANHERMKARRESGPDFEIAILMGEEEGVAAEALFLRHYMPVDPPGGALVVLPTQRSLLFHEIRNKGAVSALQTLLVVAHQLFAQGPDPILPLLYWWRRGRFALLPVEVSGEQVRFMPPVEFVATMEKLGVPLSE